MGATVAVAIISGAGGLLAGGDPTGLWALDVLLRAAVGVLGAVAGARATPRASLAGTAVLAIAAGLGSGALGFATAALGAPAALVASQAQSPLVSAGVGGLLAQVALRLEGGAHGLTAGAAVIALSVLAASAVGRAGPVVRHRSIRVAQIVAVVGVAATAAFAASALAARAPLLAGAHSLETGLTAAREGRQAAATDALQSAARSFERARRSLEAWWARPVRGVPLAAQHARALDAMAETGDELGSTAAAAAGRVDLDTLRLRQAALDLGAVAELRNPLDRVLAALTRAQTRLRPAHSPWLVSPLAQRLDDVSTRVAQARDETATAAAFVEVAPALFGGSGSRRYFLAFQTPAELRASGGIIGNFAELVADNGRLSLTRTGRAEDLNTGGSPASRRLLGPGDYLERYSRFTPHLIWQNVTASPDFPSVARVVEALYPQSGGGPIDGVISIDPIALGAFLELTGPVSVPQWPEPIGSHNAAEVLLRQQYLRLGSDFSNDDRIEFLTSVTKATFAKLTAAELPGPRRMGQVLGPMVRQGRILLHSTRAKEQSLFGRIGASGSLPPVRGDYLGVVTQNSSGNKIDLYLDRRVEYQTTVDPLNGAVDALATIRLHNRAPASGLPCLVICSSGPEPTPPGHNRLYLSVYSALGLEGARQGDEVLAMESHRERGRNVYSTFLTIPPGGRAELTLSLKGTIKGDRAYRLDIGHQPTIEPDEIVVRGRLRRAGKHTAKEVEAMFSLDRTRSFVVDYPDR